MLNIIAANTIIVPEHCTENKTKKIRRNDKRNSIHYYKLRFSNWCLEKKLVLGCDILQTILSF